jgi:hypothetical protein
MAGGPQGRRVAAAPKVLLEASSRRQVAGIFVHMSGLALARQTGPRRAIQPPRVSIRPTRSGLIPPVTGPSVAAVVVSDEATAQV